MALEPLVEARSDVLDVLRSTRALLNPDLRSAVDRMPASLRTVAGYHLGWWDATGHPVQTDSGKALRPALVFLTADAVDGSRDVARSCAVAVELVHNFSLLHDDVIDGDQVRRHRPTAWTVFGTAQAILAGDAMLALAGSVLSDGKPGCGAQAVRMLNDCVVELCQGQYLDVAFEERPDVGLADCVRMVRGKTASLMGASCALGALAGGADPQRVDLSRRFGRHVGMAFQLVDDILGIWGDSDTTGKPVGADLLRRKKSLPVVAAVASGTAAGNQLLDLYRSADPVDVLEATRLVELAGGRDWAEDYVDRELSSAVGCLDEATYDPEARDRLLEVARFCVRRTR